MKNDIATFWREGKKSMKNVFKISLLCREFHIPQAESTEHRYRTINGF